MTNKRKIQRVRQSHAKYSEGRIKLRKKRIEEEAMRYYRKLPLINVATAASATLFFDPVTCRYFTSHTEAVAKAVKTLNNHMNAILH